MSIQHPIVAVTGSSGAGTTFVKRALENIFRRESLTAATIEGDSFHSVTRTAFKQKAQAQPNFSHFGPDANDFKALEQLFKSYGETGNGHRRYYLHNDEEALFHQNRLAEQGIECEINNGEFTPWEDLEPNTDLLFYEGLHGLVKDETPAKEYGGYNVAQYVDLGVGVVPSINLEWIQKIHRDNAERGYSTEAIVDTILRRMPDYINHIVPQFSRTHINFQRVPKVDTSNPLIARDIPTADESLVVIRFADPYQFGIDFNYLKQMIKDSYTMRHDTLVVPGGKMVLAMDIILNPIIHDLIQRKSQ